MVDAAFQLFYLSLQTPLHETEENKNDGNFCIQNAIGKKTLAAYIYKENANRLYP